jgi:hypothetical protein
VHALCPFSQARDTAQQKEEEEHTDSTWKKLMLQECDKRFANSTKNGFYETVN